MPESPVRPHFTRSEPCFSKVGSDMHWWIITVVCICGALLIQYLCSSKLLRMKQSISIKTMALRDAREEGQRLDEQDIGSAVQFVVDKDADPVIDVVR